MALVRPPPSRRWRVTSETGQDLGVYEGPSPADAVARMSTLGPRGRITLGPRGRQTPYWAWGKSFGLQYGRSGGYVNVSQHAREFPLGFFDPAVGSAGGAAATPAQLTGTVSLLTPSLYGGGGTLSHEGLQFTIDGVPGFGFLFVAPADAAAALLQLNAAIAPFAVAFIQPITNFLVITTTATGSGASILITAPSTALGFLGLPPIGTLVTGTDPVTPVGVVNVISNPQLGTFRGERLVIPESIAVNFSLIDIKVGNRSQLANSTALPALIFVEGGVGMNLALDTATTAMDVALQVENNAPKPLPFMAGLIGTTFVR